MTKIKLKEWADQHRLSYITANRHFHAGMIPGAVQLDSGTILVEDDSLEQNMVNNTSGDAMSVFLKKTVEFSKNNSTVEDFAAYIISNFQLKLNAVNDGPRYSKNKPKAEEVQKHFQQFIPDSREIEHLKSVTNSLREQIKGKEIFPHDPNALHLEEPNPFTRVVDGPSNTDDETYSNMADGLSTLSAMFDGTPQAANAPSLCDPKMTTEGLVTRSVDLNTTPQQINYTGSTGQAFSSSSSINGDIGGIYGSPSVSMLTGSAPWEITDVTGTYLNAPAAGSFQPTQKEVLSSFRVIEAAETDDLPRKRGRKPSKKR